MEAVVVAAQATVEAVVAAAVGDLYEGARIDPASEDGAGQAAAFLMEGRHIRCRSVGIEQAPVCVGSGEPTLISQPIHQLSKRFLRHSNYITISPDP